MQSDIIKRAMLTGIGLALRAKDELQDIAEEYVSKGELSEKEGKKFLDDLQKRYDEAKDKLEEKIEASVKKFMKKADIATKTEIESLKKEISKLKKEIKS